MKPLVRFGISCLFILVSLTLYHIITVQGEQSDPKFVLLRLEDIGPGGQYETLDKLGKLRAVLEYLKQQHVNYHMGIIPRWENFLPDKSVYNHSLDELNDPYIQAFNKLLHQAALDSAVIGMHGYTHQVGSTRRDDNQHETGIGNEFNVPGMTETATPEYAKARIEEGLKIFRQAGIMPQFWEAPHYHTAPQQEEVFRSYFGLQYENVLSDLNQPDAQYLVNENSGYGAASLGSVYIPTPMSFIPYNRDEKLIIDQLGKKKKIASFFYHPFLEFKYLLPVQDEEGKQAYRDGLPDYKYPDKDKTILQKLILTLKDKGYNFYTIQDYVPFTPSHRMSLPTGENVKLKVGDVSGDGQADVVAWDENNGSFSVMQGQFRGLRNEPQAAPQVWLRLSKQKGDLFTLFDDNGDGKQDLWVVRVNGNVEAYHSTGKSFELFRTWKMAKTLDWSELYSLKQTNGDWIIAGATNDYSQLQAFYLQHDVLSTVAPMKWKTGFVKTLLVNKADDGMESFWIPKNGTQTCLQLGFDPATKKWKTSKVSLNLSDNQGEIRIGDFNGDGHQDVLLWNEENKTYTVFIRMKSGEYKQLSKFGPWGKTNSQLIIADFDGNEKSDLSLMNNADATLDLALSFESDVLNQN